MLLVVAIAASTARAALDEAVASRCNSQRDTYEVVPLRRCRDAAR